VEASNCGPHNRDVARRNQNRLVFFRSVFSIFRSAFRCAFAYFFVVFCCRLSAFREARSSGITRVRVWATAPTPQPTLIAPRSINAAILLI